LEAVFPREVTGNFPVTFLQDPPGNEMEKCRKKSDDFQPGSRQQADDRNRPNPIKSWHV
jgi:hypothetical protein